MFYAYGLFSYFLPAVLAGDEAQAGATVPRHMDGAHIIHPADSALAAGDKLVVVGIVHVDQFHPCADGVLLSQFL